MSASPYAGRERPAGGDDKTSPLLSSDAAAASPTTPLAPTPNEARTLSQRPSLEPPSQDGVTSPQGSQRRSSWRNSLARLSSVIGREPGSSHRAATAIFSRFTVDDFSAVLRKYLTRTFDEDLVFLQQLLTPPTTLAPPSPALLRGLASGIQSQASPADALCRGLRTDPLKGLQDFFTVASGGDEEAEFLSPGAALDARRRVYGTNAMPKRQPTSFFRLAWNVSKDFILRVLMIAGLVSLTLALIFGERKDIEWIEGAAIFMAVLIVVLVTAGNDWMKERQFASICDKDEKFCSVRRGGEQREILTSELLVGDLVIVEAGDEIFADALVISARGLAVDESSMTGETTSVKKDTLEACLKAKEAFLAARDSNSQQREKADHHALKSPVVVSGSTVLTGSATLIVIAVGPHSQTGQLMSRLTMDTEPTPLQNKLNAIARDIGNIGFAAAIVTFLVLILQFWIIWGVDASTRTNDVGSVLSQHVQFLVEAITIIVVAVPEGLPLAVTLSLAFSVGRMLKDQNYVRRLGACETMGGANEICSDKTGTLTKNIMAVEVYWNGSKQVDIKAGSSKAASESAKLLVGTAEASSDYLPEPYLQILMENIAVNSTAYFETITEQTVGKGLKNRRSSRGTAHNVTTGPLKHVGSPTECALLEFLRNAGFDYEDLRSKLGTEQNTVYRISFSSDRKIMTTVIHAPPPKEPDTAADDFTPPPNTGRPPQRKTLRVYVKGASEVVLRLCSSRIDSAGRVRRLEVGHLERIERQIIDQMAGQALRTIGIAYKDFNPEEFPNWQTLEASYNPLTGGSEFRKHPSTKKGEPLLAVPETSAAAPPTSSSAPSQPPSPYFWMETELTCLGIAGMRDPVREEVPAAVSRCQGAGIRVRMVTGDNIDTAKQIAIRCNIFHPERGGMALTGAQFYEKVGGVVCEKCRTEVCPCNNPSRAPTEETASTENEPPVEPAGSSGGDRTEKKKKKKASCCRRSQNGEADEENPAEGDVAVRVRSSSSQRVDVIGDFEGFKQIADKLEVMARSQPNDKYALVLGLKALGSVVAVTGDGTNDAPALKKADVGFAMGITGKEVAKQAADIVLLDDNFESIVKAVKWGRNIYDNIRRFLQFQLTVNVVAVITAFVGAVMLRASPLNAVQLLWVNLIMDTLASLALATEPPVESLLDRQPHARNEYLVNRIMTRNILGQAVYQLIVIFVLIFTGDRWVPERPSSYASKTGLFGGFSEFSSYGNGHEFIASGRRFRPFSSVEEYKHVWLLNVGPSRHYTVVFNTFVWLQVFNMINSRKIENEWNVFSRAFSNWMWAGIMIAIAIGQTLLVQFGGYALECHLDGLTGIQWLICLGLGAGSLLVRLCLHAVPAQKIKFIPQTGARESDLLTGPTSLALVSRGRFPDRLSARLSSGFPTRQGLNADAGRTRGSQSASAFPATPGRGTQSQSQLPEVRKRFSVF